MKNWQADCHSLLACKTKEELAAKLKVMAAKLDFDDLSLVMEARVPAASPTVAVLSHGLTDWQQHYLKSNYQSIDPRVKVARTSRLPYAWNPDSVRAAPKHFFEDWHANAHQVGWTLPFHDGGTSAAISFMREDTSMALPELNAHVGNLLLLATYAHQSLQRFALDAFQPAENEQLNLREIAVLRWAAEGKTVGESGILLNLSEDAVKFHRKGAIRKMRAANITEACVKAFALGLLV